MLPTIFFYIIVFLYGIIIGSFLNVCIYRIPKKENIVTARSHCMNCGTKLNWYELIPLFSWIALRGRCRTCKAKISVQYPLIEGLNGVLWVIVFAVCGFSVEAFLYCFAASALIALSVIDFRTFEIPIGFNLFIMGLGLIRVLTDLSNWMEYAVGFFIVSAPLYIIYLATKGRGIGGGDIKLMAAAGLLLGWKLILLAFVIGCVLGSIIHVVRMRFFGAGRTLALGAYLSVGIYVAMLWGGQMIEWYMGMLGIL